MATEGVEAVFLTTHNWGRAARFFQQLGFRLEFETDHNSGRLRNGAGAYLFIAEVPEGRRPGRGHAVRGHPLGHARHDRPRPGRPCVAHPGAGAEIAHG